MNLFSNFSTWFNFITDGFIFRITNDVFFRISWRINYSKPF
jgi:hypothetical protein